MLWITIVRVALQTVLKLPSVKLPYHLKMDGWSTSFLLGWPIFRCHVCFWECNSSELPSCKFNSEKVYCRLWIGFLHWVLAGCLGESGFDKQRSCCCKKSILNWQSYKGPTKLAVGNSILRSMFLGVFLLAPRDIQTARSSKALKTPNVFSLVVQRVMSSFCQIDEGELHPAYFVKKFMDIYDDCRHFHLTSITFVLSRFRPQQNTMRSRGRTVYLPPYLPSKQIIHIHPGRLTWNLQITYLERKIIFQTSMIMFHAC